MTQPSKLSQMDVTDFRGAQFIPQSFLVELRVMPGARNTSHVDHTRNAMRPQKRKKLFPCMGGMPDGKNSKDALGGLAHECTLMQHGKTGNTKCQSLESAIGKRFAKRAANFQHSVVGNVAAFSKLIHKKIHA